MIVAYGREGVGCCLRGGVETRKKIARKKKKARGKGYKGLKLKFHKKLLDKIAGKDGKLSEDKIKSIVDNVQFMNDYNDHPGLSYDGKMSTDSFKREMINIIQREPESFNKPNKALESYLPKVSQGK